MLTLLASHKVTRIVLVPTLLGVLLDQAPDLAARVPRLKFWTVSGEYLSEDLARRFHADTPRPFCSTCTAHPKWLLTLPTMRCASREKRPVPIGKPIANTQVYILDSHMEPVPIGVAGQIHVGGDCVSAGYGTNRVSRLSGSCQIRSAKVARPFRDRRPGSFPGRWQH